MFGIIYELYKALFESTQLPPTRVRGYLQAVHVREPFCSEH